jgi:hypothetical protein
LARQSSPSFLGTRRSVRAVHDVTAKAAQHNANNRQRDLLIAEIIAFSAATVQTLCTVSKKKPVPGQNSIPPALGLLLDTPFPSASQKRETQPRYLIFQATLRLLAA